MFSPRTDLAMEAAAILTRQPDEKLNGVDIDEYTEGEIKVSKVIITNEEGEKTIGKEKGSYITIECEALRDNIGAHRDSVSRVFSRELTKLVEPHRHRVIFVVGLGNRFVTPDSLGPLVSDGIAVSRHVDNEAVSLCTVSPGVLGITGIETGEIIEGVTDKIKPDIIIAVDALASRSMNRICTTIQLADTGITPGAGVGNTRKELSKRLLGVPVIAVGVPTVVDAATVANDSAEYILEAMADNEDMNSSIFDENQRYTIIKKILSPYFGELIVTPSQIDGVISNVAAIISDGINDMCHNL
ncbi:MAG: GPR endopeptidase [Clostridia bacterium]|nr:GPR endopeptidase [Clostridia bacterium]